MDKEPGNRSFELWDEKVWRGRGERLLWSDLDDETKQFWADLETAIEAPLLSEIERLKAKVAELEQALAANEIKRQEQIKERKRAEARVRAWEAATGK